MAEERRIALKETLDENLRVSKRVNGIIDSFKIFVILNGKLCVCCLTCVSLNCKSSNTFSFVSFSFLISISYTLRMMNFGSTSRN